MFKFTQRKSADNNTSITRKFFTREQPVPQIETTDTLPVAVCKEKFLEQDEENPN